MIGDHVYPLINFDDTNKFSQWYFVTDMKCPIAFLKLPMKKYYTVAIVLQVFIKLEYANIQEFAQEPCWSVWQIFCTESENIMWYVHNIPHKWFTFCPVDKIWNVLTSQFEKLNWENDTWFLLIDWVKTKICPLGTTIRSYVLRNMTFHGKGPMSY